MPVLVGIGLAVLAVAGAGAAVLFRGGGDGEDVEGRREPAALEFPSPGVVDPTRVAELQRIADSLRAPKGDTDCEQVRSLLGPPDTFEVVFEPESADSERLVRRETWVYFDLLTAFEFLDGDLLTNLPIDDIDGLLVLPRQYDPDQFRRETTMKDVEALLIDQAAASRTALPAELGAGLTAIAGEQLLAIFDETGGLVFAQSFALKPGEAP